MGRRPIPEDQKRVKLTLTIPPKLADRAKRNIVNLSVFVEKALKRECDLVESEEENASRLAPADNETPNP